MGGFSWLPLALLVAVTTADENPSCGGWAAAGECDANPGYMLANCRTSCAKFAVPVRTSQLIS
jgi:hypothetical protein